MIKVVADQVDNPKPAFPRLMYFVDHPRVALFVSADKALHLSGEVGGYAVGDIFSPSRSGWVDFNGKVTLSNG